MKRSFLGLVALCLMALESGCGGGGLNGNWTCHTQGQSGAVTLNLECRSDGTVVFNGSNFGAKWSGNHAILVPVAENGMNESGQLLMAMADAVVDANGRVVDPKEMESINRAADYDANRNTVQGLTERQRRDIFAILYPLLPKDAHGGLLGPRGSDSLDAQHWAEWVRIRREKNLPESVLIQIVNEGVGHKWATIPLPPAPSISPDDAKSKLKTFALRIPVKWIDSDHIDLGGVPFGGVAKQEVTPPAFGFTRTK